jgi:Ca2+-binding RTX toxin-like protein
MATVTIEGIDYNYDQAIIGSDAVADTLVGNDNLVRYYISGLGLNDKLTGAGDDDILIGGFGSDTLKGRAGDDLLIGDHLTAQGWIISELDLDGTAHGSVSPPGDNANWKAWENYENHLTDFMAHLDLTATYRLNGVEMSGQALAGKWAAYNDHLTVDDVHVISGKKIENTNGNDTANHDITDNLALWAALTGADAHQTDSAAFVDFGTVQAVPNGDHIAVIDTAVFSGPLDHYKLTIGPDSLAVRDTVGTDGTDTLIGIEKLQFADVTLDTSWFSSVASLPGHQFDDLTDMYIAYFDRAPDAVGLCYWASRLADGMTLQQIAKSFFVQPETLAAYPAGQPTEAFVTKVYNNMLGRAPDAPGLNYWMHDLDSGALSRDSFMLAVIYGAQTSDVQYLANKHAVGKAFAVDAGLSDVTWARAVMHGVDGSAASVTAAQALTDQYAATASTTAGAHLVVELVGVAG